MPNVRHKQGTVGRAVKRLALGLGLLAAASATPLLAAQGQSSTSPKQEAKPDFVSNLTNLPRDLAYMQAHKIPMMLFFHASYCGYCKMIDNQFIIPMRLDPAYRGRLLIRRVQIDAQEKYIGRDGKPHHYLKLANRLEVRGVPLVLFVGPDGQRIASITGTAPGFYNYYLDQYVDRATKCAKDMSQPGCHDKDGGPAL